MEIPGYWKGSVEDIAETLKEVKKGEVLELCTTPGGRTVSMVCYGHKNNLRRTANYSSAMGAGDFSAYADKTAEDYVPTVLLIGAVHGGEFEGTVAINNLIHNIETGRDYAGNENKSLIEAMEGINLLLIPCANMDGRARVPLKTFAGQDFEGFRHYSQGTKGGGELIGYPACKLTHPIKEISEFLGGYFNDDGVNIMHDNFFMPMAEETKALLKVADEYVPDMTIQLHGGGNCRQVFMSSDYVPKKVREKIQRLSDSVKQASIAAGVGDHYHNASLLEGRENNEVPPSFNLVSAWTALCGEPCICYESNQGLNLSEEHHGHDNSSSFEEIYLHHRILFETVFRFVKE